MVLLIAQLGTLKLAVYFLTYTFPKLPQQTVEENTYLALGLEIQLPNAKALMPRHSANPKLSLALHPGLGRGMKCTQCIYRLDWFTIEKFP